MNNEYKSKRKGMILKGIIVVSLLTISIASLSYIVNSNAVNTVKLLGTTSTPTPAYTVLIDKNSSAADITILQKKLYNVGYDITVDGKFGTETTNSIKAFQKSAGITQTGTYTYSTKIALELKANIRNYDSVETKKAKFFADLKASVTAYLAKNKANIGFIYYDINSGYKIEVNPNKVCTAASTYKVGMNIVAYNKVNAGKLNLSEGLKYSSKYYEAGTGILQGQKSTTLKKPISIQTLLSYSIKYSDNIATNMMSSKLGGTSVVRTAVGSLVGISTFNGQRKNLITPEIEFRLLKLLYNNRANTNYARLIKDMKETSFHDRIDLYLPHSLVAHKIGNYGAWTNDVGIIFTEQPYIFVMYTNGVTGSNSVIANLSKLIYKEQLKLASIK